MEAWDSVSLDRVPRLAIVIGHAGLRRDLERSLATLGCRVEGFDRASDALAMPGVDAVVLDLDAGGPTIDVVALEASTGVPVVGLSSVPGTDPDTTVLAKPFSIASLERALRTTLSRAADAGDFAAIDPMLETREPRVERILERADRAAEDSLPIVIEGELGVGRRALARAIHRASDRGATPVAVLDRTELASAGPADAQEIISAGFERARVGTLLVVEPAEWSVAGQRALDRALRAEAGPRLMTIATRSLEEDAAAGRLLRELGDRLDVVRLALPPLRERPADHRAICDAVARLVARRMACETPSLDDATLVAWAEEGFPGNRLGLESRIRSALLSEASKATESGAVLDVRRHDEDEGSLDLKSLERDTIVRALAFWQGNRTRASESLGISVRTLRNKIRDYGLR